MNKNNIKKFERFVAEATKSDWDRVGIYTSKIVKEEIVKGMIDSSEAFYTELQKAEINNAT